MVHRHFIFAGNMSVLDNILLGTRPLWRAGFGRAAARRRIAALMGDYDLQVDMDAATGALSVGARQRIEILKALYRAARVLILDEPTAVLTPAETDALFDTLCRAVVRGLAVIFISRKPRKVMAISVVGQFEIRNL